MLSEKLDTVGKAEFVTVSGQLFFECTSAVPSWSWSRELTLLLAHGHKSLKRVMDDACGAFLQRSFIE